MALNNIRDVEQLLHEAIGNIDPNDPKGRKRLRIIQAASELFTDQSYRKTNVGEIARAAGVAKGTVYLYFKTKVDILIAAIALEKAKSLKAFAPIFDGTLDAGERLHQWIEQTLLVPANSPLIGRLITGDEDMAAALAEMDPKLLARQHDDGHGFLGKLIREATPGRTWSEAELEARINVMSSLAFLAPHLRAPHVRQALPVEAFAKIFADLIVTGIQKEVEP